MATFREVAFQFQGEATPLIQELRKITAHMKAVPSSKRIQLAAKTEAAHAAIKGLENRLEELDNEHTDIEITADLKKLSADLVRARMLLAALPDNKVVDVKARLKVERDVNRVGEILARSVAGVGKLIPDDAISGPMKQAIEPTFNLTGAFSKMSLILRRIPPLFAGIAVVIFSTLLPAIMATIAAIGALVTAIASLSAALVAALGPAIALAVGLFQRLAKIMEAREARQKALTDATKAAGEAEEKAAAAAEKRHDAERAVQGALENRRAAEENLSEARRVAAEAIQDARDRELESAKRVQDANVALGQATANAYRAMEDAIEGASDARRELEGAKLSKEAAQLDLKEARLQLKQFRKDAGLTAKSFDPLFAKFDDVHFTPKGIGAALKGAGVKDEEGLLEGERLALNLKRALLGVRDADDGVSDAQREANRAQQDANEYRRQGIAANSSYVSALEGVRDAERDHADALRERNRLEALGVAGAPGVKDALRGVANSEDAVREARHNQQLVLKDLKREQDAQTASMEDYRQKRDALTAGEQKFLVVIDAIGAAFRNTVGPAVDAVIGGLAGAAAGITGPLSGLKGAMTGLGEEWSRQIGLFGKQLISPQNIAAFGTFVAAATELSSLGGSIFRDLFQIFINVAQGAMPLLIDGFRELSEWLGGVAEGTSDIGAITEFLAPMVALLGIALKAMKDLGVGIVASFDGASGPINDFFGAIGGGIRKFADFAKSAKGQEKIREFFEDTLPFVKSFIKFLGLVFLIFIKAIQIAMPILKPFLDLINFILQVFLLLLKAIDFVIGPFKTLLGVLLTLLVPFSVAAKAARGLIAIFEQFPFFIGFALRGIIDFGSKLVAPFRNGWNAIKAIWNSARGSNLFRGFIDGVSAAISRVPEVIRAPFRIVFTWLRDRWNSFKGFIERLAAGLGRPFDATASFIRNVFDKLSGWIKTALNVGIIAINWMIRALQKIKFSVPDWVPEFLGGGKTFQLLGRVGQIPLLAAGGIVGAGTAFIAGESGREAVLPLNDAVLRRLGQSIVRATQVGAQGPLVGSFAGAGRAGIQIGQINLPPAPAAQVPDARHQAAQLAMELRRRGGV